MGKNHKNIEFAWRSAVVVSERVCQCVLLHEESGRYELKQITTKRCKMNEKVNKKAVECCMLTFARRWIKRRRKQREQNCPTDSNHFHLTNEITTDDHDDNVQVYLRFTFKFRFFFVHTAAIRHVNRIYSRIDVYGRHAAYNMFHISRVWVWVCASISCLSFNWLWALCMRAERWQEMRMASLYWQINRKMPIFPSFAYTSRHHTALHITPLGSHSTSMCGEIHTNYMLYAE